MNKKRYQKYLLQKRNLYKDKPCEVCGKQHDHTYGSGRFCSNSCRMSYIASRNKFNEKHKSHLQRLHSRSAKHGNWKCEECNLTFETRAKLDEHNKYVHNKVFTSCIEGKEHKYVCAYCGKEFDKSNQLKGHLSNCPNHPNKEKHDLGHKKSGKTYKEKLQNGLYEKHNLGFTKGSCHSNETKQKISEKRTQQVQNEYLNNFHAKVKWYKTTNIKGEEWNVRGTWELNVAKRLNELGIYWTKAPPIRYFKEYQHNYTADLYVPEMDVYVEVKGRYPDSDREKMRLVCQQNPDKKIYFIHDQYEGFIDRNVEFNDCLAITEKDL